MALKKNRFIIMAVMAALWGTTAFAQDRRVQMIFESDVAPDLKAQLMVTADPSQRLAAQENFKKACQHAQSLLQNPDEPFVQGFLADTIATDLAQAGFADLYLQLGDVYVARGEDFNGPWKVPVVDQTTANAQHTFFYKAHNTAAATVRLGEGNAGIKAADLKSVTVFSEEGALQAQRLASGASALSLEKAKKFLKVAGVSRAVLIDSDGKFIQIPEK